MDTQKIDIGGDTAPPSNILSDTLGGVLIDNLSDDDLRKYLEIIRGALEVHNDREKKRHGLWKEYTPHDQLKQVKIKVERILRVIENNKLHPDEISADIIGEGLDIINYTVFAIRQAKRET